MIHRWFSWIDSNIIILSNIQYRNTAYYLIFCAGFLWPEGRVPYVISDSFNASQKQAINSAIGITEGCKNGSDLREMIWIRTSEEMQIKKNMGKMWPRILSLDILFINVSNHLSDSWKLDSFGLQRILFHYIFISICCWRTRKVWGAYFMHFIFFTLHVKNTVKWWLQIILLYVPIVNLFNVLFCQINQLIRIYFTRTFFPRRTKMCR